MRERPSFCPICPLENRCGRIAGRDELTVAFDVKGSNGSLLPSFIIAAIVDALDQLRRLVRGLHHSDESPAGIDPPAAIRDLLDSPEQCAIFSKHSAPSALS
jgi:hypothetical protein